MSLSLQPHVPAPGSIVSTPILLGYRHLGIVSDRFHGDLPMVISNSSRSGGVEEEPWALFLQGGPVRVERHGQGLDAARIVARARSRLGTPYDLFRWNCEHLVTFALGRNPQSPQLRATVATLALGWAIFGFRGM